MQCKPQAGQGRAEGLALIQHLPAHAVETLKQSRAELKLLRQLCTALLDCVHCMSWEVLYQSCCCSPSSRLYSFASAGSMHVILQAAIPVL